MKKLLPILLFAGFSSPAFADITHKLSSSIQLQVNAAATQVERIGSSWSVSGNGVDTTDGTTVNTVSAGTITSGVMAPGTIAATQDVQVQVSATLLHTFKVMRYHNLHQA